MSALEKLRHAVSSTLHAPWFDKDYIVIERRDLAVLLREHEELRTLAAEYIDVHDIHR